MKEIYYYIRDKEVNNMECSCVAVDLTEVNVGQVKRRITEEPEAVCLLCCYECRKTIKIGERFRKERTELFSNLGQNKSFTITTCMDCISIRDTFFCDGWFYGETLKWLKMHIEEKDGNISEDCLAQLTPKAREVVCELIELHWNRWVEPIEPFAPKSGI